MTETVGTSTDTSGPAAPRRGLTIARVHTTAGVHPYDEVEWERRDVVMTNWRDGSVNFEQRGVEFPRLLVGQRGRTSSPASTSGVPSAPTPARRACASSSTAWSTATPSAGRSANGYFATPSDAEAFSDELTWMLLQPVLQLQLAGLVQRRDQFAPAGQCVLHPVGRRHDGVDPQLVPRGRTDLQGRFRGRPQPLAHPFVQGAAVLRRHRVRAGVVHAGGGRVRGHHQVRGGHPPRGEDGRPRRRPPRHHRVRGHQALRGAEDPRPARRRLRHGSRRLRHHVGAVPEREQLGAGLRRVHALRAVRFRSSASAPA